jgi:hypothetical protein
VNWQSKFTSYAVQNGLGHMYDMLHPNAALYDIMGSFLSDVLVAA